MSTPVTDQTILHDPTGEPLIDVIAAAIEDFAELWRDVDDSHPDTVRLAIADSYTDHLRRLLALRRPAQDQQSLHFPDRAA